MSDLCAKVKALETKLRPDKPSMILVASGENFVAKGTGEVFSRAEALELEAHNKAVLVEFRIVYKEDR